MPKLTSFFLRCTLFALTLAFLASCSAPDIKEDSIHFHSRITSSGLKHFQVTIVLPPDQNSRRQAQRNNTSSRGDPGERMAQRAEKTLIAIAELKIQETQFCRDGYWFLGNNFYGRKVYIRGECNETASEEDREKFPDTLLYW